MNYEITLDFYYQTFDSFKQKSCLILQGLFANGRMIDYAKFHGYGIITTNCKKADKIAIEELNKFVRSKTNCIIYDLTYNKYNPGIYDKLFIYKSDMSRDNAFYGYILYNTETHKMVNKYILDYMDDKLYQYIYMSIISLPDIVKFNHYGKRYDAVKNRNGLTVKDCPTRSDYEEMYQYYEDLIKLPFDPRQKFAEE